jgi:hypothetical protein
MTRPTIEDLRIIYNLPSLGVPVTRSDLLAALGLVIECEECGGTGKVQAHTADCIGTRLGVVSGPAACEHPEVTCSYDCAGSGYQVAPELVELVYQTNPAAGRENAEQLLRQVFEKEEK